MIKKLISIGIPGCFVLLCVLTCSPAASIAHQSAYGIFALSDANKGIPSEVYSNPNIDGVSLRYRWDEIQPQPNTFNWSRIDADINTARRHGKKVSLSVAPGAHTPSWVYAAGAASFPIIWNRPFGGLPECSRQRIPIPWDSAYLSRWTNFVQQLGRRYGSNSAVVLVWLTGINTYSAETNLPHSGSMQAGQPACPIMPDYDAQWRAAGYSQDKVLSAWLAIIDAFARSFPEQRLVSSITPGGFPVTGGSSSFAEDRNSYGGGMTGASNNRSGAYGGDNDEGSAGGGMNDYGAGTGASGTWGGAMGNGRFGRSMGPGGLAGWNSRGRMSGMGGGGMKREALAFTLEMNSAAVNRYGSRIIVMNDALSAVHAWQPKGDLTKASIAYQMLYRVSRDPKCMMNRFVSPCDPRTMLQAALNNGINAGAKYIEVYAIDTIDPDLQGTLADAHRRLSARVP